MANTVALNKPLSYIYAMTKEKINYPTSFKAKTNPEPRRGTEYCAYHQTNGHKTDEFRVLAGIIQKLIREGHLKEYIKDKSEENQPNGQTQKAAVNLVDSFTDDDLLNLSPPRNRIDVIHGGPHPAGSDKGARSRYLREARGGIFSCGRNHR